MQRISGPTAVTDGNGPGKTGFIDANSPLGRRGTFVTAPIMNALQEEIASVIEAMGLTLNPNDNTQLLQAIQAAIGTMARGMFAPEPTVPASMSVVIAAGYLPGAATVTLIPAQTTAAFAAPASNSRIDRIVINRTTGAVSVVAGAPAAAPVAPALPAGTLPIAQITLTAGRQAITAAMITDERDLPPLGLGSAAFSALSSAVASVVAAIIGPVAAGNIPVFKDGGGSIGDSGVSASLLMAPATAAVPGIARFATPAEAKTGTAQDIAVTPLGMSQALNAQAIQAGCVAHFAQSAPPLGWLAANGATVNRSVYANLFAAIGTTYGAGDGSTTFTLPDLRGEFIRGADAGRGVDAGRTVGSWQNGTHITGDDGLAPNVHGIGYLAECGLDPADGVARAIFYTTASGTAAMTTYWGRVRPRNTALLACIKY